MNRVSVSRGGKQGNGDSSMPDSGSLSVSSDGRFVAFESAASNLIKGDTNGELDVFVKDVRSGVVKRASESTNGKQGSDTSDAPSLSGDGRFVAFQSVAGFAIPGDKNYNQHSVYVKDLQTGLLRRVSLSTPNHPEKKYISLAAPSLSSDGRFVAFFKANIDADPDPGSRGNVFVKDLQSGLLRLISSDISGQQGNNDSLFPSISADGRVIAFESDASNLVTASPKLKNPRTNIFGVSWQEKQLPAESIK